MSLAVVDLSLYFISVLTPIPIVQLLNLSDLGAETPNFFAKHCEMIHTTSIAFRTIECRSPIRPSENKRWSLPPRRATEEYSDFTLTADRLRNNPYPRCSE